MRDADGALNAQRDAVPTGLGSGVGFILGLACVVGLSRPPRRTEERSFRLVWMLCCFCQCRLLGLVFFPCYFVLPLLSSFVVYLHFTLVPSHRHPAGRLADVPHEKPCKSCRTSLWLFEALSAEGKEGCAPCSCRTCGPVYRPLSCYPVKPLQELLASVCYFNV